METIKLMASLQMRRAMKDLLTETFKRKLTPRDIEWVRRLLFELRDRVNDLTPNRPDLHAEFNAAFDVDLMMQMIEHDAMDAEEQQRYAKFLFDKLQASCAPCQDRRVQKAVEGAKGKDMGWLIYEANAIIDDIELLSRATRGHSHSQVPESKF